MKDDGPPLVQSPTRLTALDRYGILDTPEEPGFDDIVTLASQICETPVALVSFVASDRQWFKARIGFGPCETPLSQSVCAHALALDDILVIPDLTQDPRTRENRLVTSEPHIRFYAGAVLKSPDHEPLGTLCVIDGKPRPGGLTDAQTVALNALARQVMTQLRKSLTSLSAPHSRLEANEKRLAKSEERLTLALGASGLVGTWDYDLKTDKVYGDAVTANLYGSIPAW